MSATHPASSRQDASRAPGARPAMRAAVKALRRPLNPLIVRLAGSRRLRSFAVVQHRGRRSGRVYATPVSARPAVDGFIIPLTLGEGADWFQNLRVAGSGVVRWNGREYPVVDPEIVNWAAARAAFGLLERIGLRLFGIAWFARVRHAPGGAGNLDRDSSAGSQAPGGHLVPIER